MIKIAASCMAAVLLLSLCAAPSTIQGDDSSGIHGGRYDRVQVADSGDGDTLYVGGSGTGNYTTIQAAVTAAKDGDTVFVYDDSSPYYENVVVQKSIQLEGENRHSTVVIGVLNTPTIVIAADDVILCRVTVHHTQRSPFRSESDGVSIRGANVTIQNNYISENWNHGISVRGASSVRIVDNEINRNIWVNIYMADATDAIIANNTIVRAKLNVLLRGASHNTISSNVIGHSNGLHMDGASSHNSIVANTFENCGDSITMRDGCSDNRISDNRITESSRIGVIIHEGCLRNTARNNTFTRTTIGIECRSPSTIEKNTFTRSGIRIFSKGNRVEGNTANGKPIIYLENRSHVAVNESPGQVILICCDNVTIDNHTIANTSVGVQLWHSRYCSIANTTCTGNTVGIHIGSSSHIHVADNVLQDNENALHIQGTQNTVAHNQLLSNMDGIWLGYSSNNSIQDNHVANTRYTGIDLYDSSENRIENNTLIDGFYGIHVRYSSNNRFLYNVFKSNSEGISLDSGTSNVIVHNALYDDGLRVRQVASLRSNVIRNNTVNDKPLVLWEEKTDEILPDVGQAILVGCSNVTLRNQTISDTTTAVTLWNCTNCRISSCDIYANSDAGIELHTSSCNVIHDNQLHSNRYGIRLYDSSSNDISGNTLLAGGLLISRSDENLVSGNRFSANERAVSIDASSGNRLKDNIFSENNNAMVVAQSNGNHIHRNDFIDNENDVILYSFHNLWTRNYWDTWHMAAPKPILGHLGQGILTNLPWLNVDWCPRLMPQEADTG